MKKLATTITLLLAIFATGVIAQSNSKQTPPKETYEKETAVLIIFEIEAEHKTILVGDGLSPLYWRFRVPDSKWEAVIATIKVEDEVCLTWVGPELSDPASLATSDEYNGLVVLRGLTVYKPVKVF